MGKSFIKKALATPAQAEPSAFDNWVDHHRRIAGAATGFMLGGSLAAISGLIADRIEANRQLKRKKERESTTISPDTVVLFARKPTKMAQAACNETHDGCQVNDQHDKPKVEPAVSSKLVRYLGNSQPREPNGRYSSLGKTAEQQPRGFSWDRMWDNGWGLALGIGAMPLGYAVVNKLHTKLEENRLKKQIAAAQTEYIDLLQGNTKDAEALEFLDMVGIPRPSDIEKTAQAKDTYVPETWLGKLVHSTVESDTARSVGNSVERLGSAGLAALLLSTGATAYITRKLLQHKFDKEKPDDEPERVTRILFKSGSSEMEITPDQMLFTIAVMQDCLADSIPFEKIAMEMDPNDQRWVQYNNLVTKLQDPKLHMTPVELAEFLNGDPNAQLHFSPLGRRMDYRPSFGKSFTPESFRQHLLDEGVSEDQLNMITVGNMKAMEALRAAQANEATRGATSIDNVSDDEMQHLLDAYGADKFGVKSEHTYDNFAKAHPELAGRIMNAAGSTDPAKAKGVMEAYMRANPEKWMNMVGSDRNSALRTAAVDNYINGLRSGKGFAGFLMNLPGIGGIVENFMRMYANSGMGRRAMIRRMGKDMGVDQAAIDNYIKNTNFNQTGWAPKAVAPDNPGDQPGQTPVQTAQTPPAQTTPTQTPPDQAQAGQVKSGHVIKKGGVFDVINTLANVKVLDDITNKDLNTAIDRDHSEPGIQLGPKKKKGQTKKLSMKIDKELLAQLTPEQRMQLFFAVRKIKPPK